MCVNDLWAVLCVQVDSVEGNVGSETETTLEV